MVIKIEWDDKEQILYRADCLDCPGTPPIGRGVTKELAVASLFGRLINENAGPTMVNWLPYIDFDHIEIEDQTK